MLSYTGRLEDMTIFIVVPEGGLGFVDIITSQGGRDLDEVGR